MDSRYIIRKEFFGGVVWDKKLKTYFSISHSIFEKLLEEDFDSLPEDILLDHSFLDSDNEKNYKIVKEENKSDEFLDFPLRVHLAITENCNMNCKHCFFEGVKDSWEDFPSEDSLTLGEIKDLFDEMVSNGCFELFIAGGEPFVRDDIMDILKEASKRDIQIKIFTNGLMINEEIIGELNQIENIYYLSVSMEDTDREKFNEFRGGEFYNQVVDNLKLLSEEANFRTYIRWSIGSNNLDRYEDIISFSERIGIKGIKIRPIVPSGNAIENEDIIPSYEEYLEFLYNISKCAKDHDIRVEGSFSLHYDPNLRFSKKTIGFADFISVYLGFGGQGGYTSVYIDNRGYVTYCVMTYPDYLPDEDDNIKNKTLSELWFKSNSIEKKRDLEGNEECLNCKYYPSCRGGCRARAYYEYGDYNAPDPWCRRDLERNNPELIEKTKRAIDETH